MTRKVVSPIALDKSFNTTEQTPRNIADVLAQQLEAIKTAIENGNGNLEAAFVCYYGVTTATQIKDAIEDGKVPYFYYNGAVAQLWKVETDKYTFRTTNTRSVEGQTILDVVDYVVNGSVWSTVTREVSGGSSGGQSYIASVNSLADFDTTGYSGMQDLISVANVPADGVYQVSVMLHITPKTASATKSDLALQFTSSDNSGWPSHTFHAVVDDSQTFAQQLSFSTSVSLKAGQNTLKISCDSLNTQYLVFVDELTVAQLVNGVYHNGDDFADVHTLTEAADFNNDDGVLVDGATGGPRFMLWQTLANKVLGFIKSLSTTITAFRTGDYIVVDGTSGTAKMSTDDLLRMAAGTVVVGTVYQSLQDAISDAANLLVGDIFETNGFYTSGDGGAARYLVSDTGTANGMDIIQLAAGKLAVLQIESSTVTLEQLGYIPSDDDSNYIEPYISRVLNLPVSVLQLQTGTYFFHTNIVIKKKGFTLRGLGSEITTLKQISIGLFGLQFEYRELTLEDFTLAGPSNSPASANGVGVCTRQWNLDDANVSHYNYTFRNLVVTGFRTGFELGGEVKWQTKFDNVRVSLCYNGISFVESGFCYELNRVLTDRCENAGLYVFGQVDALLNNCNLGSISSAIRFDPWSYGSVVNTYYESTLLFNGCNFELDREVSPCPGAFVYVSDTLNVNLNFVSCRFTWNGGMKLAGNYGLSLGDQCCVKIDSCELYLNTPNALVSNFFDPSRNPKKKVGSVIISGNSRCSQKSRMPQWSFPDPLFGSKFKPTLINFSKSGVAHYDDNTNFLQNYGGTSNGTMLYNDSDNCLYTFINGTLCKITHQPGGANNTVYIYNRLYSFVKIGELLWLTENLDIPTENSVPITNYGSGQYYPIDDYESLAEYIPLDWRLPTRAECRDSLAIVEGTSPNAKKCCSTSYPSIWPAATNEYGLSMLPNGSSESVDPTRAFWWTSSKGGSDDKTPIYFGVDDVRGMAFSSYTAKIPIRLVKVAR